MLDITKEELAVLRIRKTSTAYNLLRGVVELNVNLHSFYFGDNVAERCHTNLVETLEIIDKEEDKHVPR